MVKKWVQKEPQADNSENSNNHASKQNQQATQEDNIKNINIHDSNITMQDKSKINIQAKSTVNVIPPVVVPDIGNYSAPSIQTSKEETKSNDKQHVSNVPRNENLPSLSSDGVQVQSDAEKDREEQVNDIALKPHSEDTIHIVLDAHESNEKQIEQIEDVIKDLLLLQESLMNQNNSDLDVPDDSENPQSIAETVLESCKEGDTAPNLVSTSIKEVPKDNLSAKIPKIGDSYSVPTKSSSSSINVKVIPRCRSSSDLNSINPSGVSSPIKAFDIDISKNSNG